jgi:hypothetical protein
MTLAVVVQIANANTISCDFANVAGASIQFIGTGDKIEFPNTGTYDFLITDATSPSLSGLLGNIGGTFFVGSISNPFAGAEQASVTTTDGTFSVYDGVAATLTANLNLEKVTVYNGLVGFLNVTGTANLSNVNYLGGNSGLTGIANGTDQTVVLSFQFSPVAEQSLAQLMTDGAVNSTSYSGSLSSVPEPSSCLMLGCVAVGLWFAVRFRRKTV